MIALGDLPRFGLYRGDFDLSRRLDKRRVLTVRVGPERKHVLSDSSQDDHGSILYEIEKADEEMDSKLVYRVFGVWVPTFSAREEVIGAELDMSASSSGYDGSDAFIL